MRCAQEMEALGRSFADTFLRNTKNELLLLYGDVGVGKTVFARGLIRSLLRDENEAVRSPTYLLEQEYATDKLVIRHYDFYRFEPEMTLVDAKAIDWFHAVKNDICIVECPERIKDRKMLLPLQGFYEAFIEFDQDDENVRQVILQYHRSTSG